MIPLALKALPWRYIGIALAVLAYTMFIFNSGKQQERDRLQPKLDAALANVATLKAGLADQNTAIAKQGQQQEAVAKASVTAIQRGAERRGRVDAMAARVEAVQPSGGLVVPDDVRRLWKDM
jgi:predicted phage gp36 major capsid-like protein